MHLYVNDVAALSKEVAHNVGQVVFHCFTFRSMDNHKSVIRFFLFLLVWILLRNSFIRSSSVIGKDKQRE